MTAGKISNDEAQIYDRQIRLWGMDAQNRLRNSSVLLVGLSGLGAEIGKNLMLSGIKSLTLMDHKEVGQSDRSSQFLIPTDAKTKNRAEASLDRLKQLNPMVEVAVDTDQLAAKADDFFTIFDLVILIDQDFKTTDKVNKICRKNKIRFQAGGVFGWIGYAFFDFNNHVFLLPKPKETQAIIESVLDDDEEEEHGGGGGEEQKNSTDGAGGSSSSADGPAAKKGKVDKGVGGGGATSLVPTFTLEDEEDSKVKMNIPFPSFEQIFAAKLGIKKLLRRRFSLPAAYYVIRAFLGIVAKEEEPMDFSVDQVVDKWKQELQEAAIDESKQSVSSRDFNLFMKPALNLVCAIVGSVLSQEAIKALSQNDVPLKNVFFYSALETAGIVCEIGA